jgi:hypothetical protein
VSPLISLSDEELPKRKKSNESDVNPLPYEIEDSVSKAVKKQE